MNAHEIIDRIGSKTPRQKLVAALLVLVALLIVAFGFMYLGYIVFGGWADSKYLRESQKRDEQIAVLKAKAAQHEQNEIQLAAENGLLKKQNEAMAESLRQADTERERQALADQAKRDAERSQRFGEIDADQNFESQLKATCDEYKARGFTLSFCARFEGQ